MAALLLLVIVPAGCLTPGSDNCRLDSECPGECANTGDCVPAGSTRFVRIHWTVHGATPDETSCSPIAELEVAFSGDGDGSSYRPVPCEVGQITFTKLPAWFDTVEVSAWSEAGILLCRFEAAIAEPNLVMSIDLQP